MSDQDDFLNALGVTVDGVPVDREGQEAAAAALEAATHAPNPPGTNNYYFPPTMPVMDPDTMRPGEAALQQATFNGRAVNDFRNTGRRDSETEENIARMRDPSRGEMDEDLDEEERWRRDQDPHTLLMGEEELEDYGDYEDESDGTSIVDSVDGYSDPERILCESDQDFPRRGHLFLVKWKECSVLRSSWEWESESFEDVMEGRPQFLNFLKQPHPIRMEWEARKERIARREEEKFDVAKWQFDVRDERVIRAEMRLLRRWKRKLEGSQRVLETQRRDEEEDFPGDAVRIEKEDREDKIREEAEKRTAEQERKRAREDEDVEMDDVSSKRTA